MNERDSPYAVDAPTSPTSATHDDGSATIARCRSNRPAADVLVRIAKAVRQEESLYQYTRPSSQSSSVVVGARSTSKLWRRRHQSPPAPIDTSASHHVDDIQRAINQ